MSLLDWINESLPAAAPSPKSCKGFAWLGQSFKHCDRCGLPYWEHTHDQQFSRDRGPFDADPWVLVPITPEQAEATRRKWQ